jgi:predicted ATPase
MSDTVYSTFQHYGTAAQRAAFVPNPAAGIQPIYIWYETDTGDTYLFDTTWHLLSGAASVTTTFHPFLTMGG